MQPVIPVILSQGSLTKGSWTSGKSPWASPPCPSSTRKAVQAASRRVTLYRRILNEIEARRDRTGELVTATARAQQACARPKFGQGVGFSFTESRSTFTRTIGSKCSSAATTAPAGGVGGRPVAGSLDRSAGLPQLCPRLHSKPPGWLAQSHQELADWLERDGGCAAHVGWEGKGVRGPWHRRYRWPRRTSTDCNNRLLHS